MGSNGRRLIVHNLVSLDCFQDYADDQRFDEYSTELLRSADTLLLNSRKFFLETKTYWTQVPADPRATAIRREFAAFIERVEKVVVSDVLKREETPPWEGSTRVVRRADAHEQIRALKGVTRVVLQSCGSFG